MWLICKHDLFFHLQVDSDVVIQSLHFENCLRYRPLIYIKTQSADWIMLNAV